MSQSLQIGWCGPSHGPWGWIQSHFDQLTRLDALDIEDWIASQKSKGRVTSNALLFIALEDRADLLPFESIIRQLSLSSKTAFAFLLGNDWQGYRRTYPFLDGVPVFYWYQWYDQVFPWICELHGGLNEVREPRGKHKRVGSQSDMNIAWRVQWSLDRARWLAKSMQSIQGEGSLAWLITDHADSSLQWQDACSALGLRWICSRWDRDLVWLDPELIIVDSVSRSEDSRRSIESTVQFVRRRHPEACFAVVAPMPTWEQWCRLQSYGVDVVLPRPALPLGFLSYWQRWKTQVEQCSG